MHTWKKALGEFAIIVVGVLVALAVDDLRQDFEDGRTEEHILHRLARDVERDLDDLDRVILRAERRIWVAEALLREMRDPWAEAESPLPERGAWADPSRSAFDLPFDPVQRPLREFLTWTEFDLSEATYRELLQTGVIRVIRSDDLREEISRYYFRAVDATRSDQRNGVAQEGILETLLRAGLVPTDPVSMDEVVERLRKNAESGVEIRKFRYLTGRQLASYRDAFERAGSLRTALLDAQGG